jgi:hypothetical protein
VVVMMVGIWGVRVMLMLFFKDLLLETLFYERETEFLELLSTYLCFCLRAFKLFLTGTF